MKATKALSYKEILINHKDRPIEYAFECAFALGYKYFQHQECIYEVKCGAFWDATNLLNSTDTSMSNAKSAKNTRQGIKRINVGG